MGFKMKGPSMNISYGGESNKQQKSNLLKDNPVAKHASAMNMIGSPLNGLGDGKTTAQNLAERKRLKEEKKIEKKPEKKIEDKTEKKSENKVEKKSSGKTSYKEAYTKRDKKTYGGMSEEEYTKEAKRQNESKKKTGKFDAPSKPITKAKVEKKVEKKMQKKVEKKVQKKVEKEKVAPKSKKEIRQENRANRKAGRKERRSARLDKKIEKQTNKGKAAGDGGEKGIDSQALKKSKRVTNLKKRKVKADKGTEREVKSDSPAANYVKNY